LVNSCIFLKNISIIYNEKFNNKVLHDVTNILRIIDEEVNKLSHEN